MTVLNRQHSNVRLGSEQVDAVYAGAIKVWPPELGYLNGSGNVTTPATPDMAIDGDIRATSLLRVLDWDLPLTSARSQYLAGYRDGSNPRWDWRFYQTTTGTNLYHDIWPNGVRNPPNKSVANMTQLSAAMPAGQDAYFGVEIDVGSEVVSRGLYSTDGETWDYFPNAPTGPATEGTVAGTHLMVGATLTSNASPWAGRIYWAQMEAVNRARLMFPGTEAGNYVAVPGVADVTGAIDIVARIEPYSWRPELAQTIVAKYRTAGANRVYRLQQGSGGGLTFYVSTDGVGVVGVNSNAVIPASQTGALWLRVVRKTNGEILFYSAPDQPLEPVSWDSLGTVVAAASGNLFSAPIETRIGKFDQTSANLPFRGAIHRVIVRDGIGSTAPVVLDAMANNAGRMSTPTTFLTTSGHIATVSDASIVQPLPDRLMWRFDAMDYLGGSSFVGSLDGRTYTLNSPTGMTFPY